MRLLLFTDSHLFAELFAAGPPVPQQMRALALEYGYEIFAPTASADRPNDARG